MVSMFRTKYRLIQLLGAAVAFGACADDDGDGTTDTGSDTGADTGSDTATDAGTDTGSDTPAGPCDGAPATLTVDADIAEETWWCADTEITLAELVFVSAPLHIEAGTTVLGENGSALVITTDGVIDAVGTAAAPIVFTSSFGDDGEAGDWGGLVLLGNATINTGSSNIEGMDASAGSRYGGTDDTHDCGTLRYVRIEYAGSVFGEDNELNGLTVGGCGSDTTLEYVQVHKGLDDGIEFFGGTVSLKWAVVTQTGDDSFDWDQGWRGNAQFLVAQQSATAGDRGFECDSLEDNNDAAPRSNPTVFNVTLVSADSNGDQRGWTLRRGTAATIGNVVMTGFEKEPTDIEGDVTAGFWGDELTFTYFMNFANAGWGDESGDSDDDGGFDEAGSFAAAEGYSTADPQLADAENLTAPDFVPATGSPAADGGPTPGGWFDEAPYYGAFEPGGANWMDGWTAFP